MTCKYTNLKTIIMARSILYGRSGKFLSGMGGNTPEGRGFLSAFNQRRKRRRGTPSLQEAIAEEMQINSNNNEGQVNSNAEKIEVVAAKEDAVLLTMPQPAALRV